MGNSISIKRVNLHSFIDPNKQWHKVVNIFFTLSLTFSMGAQKILIEMVLLSTHNLCFS